MIVLDVKAETVLVLEALATGRAQEGMLLHVPDQVSFEIDLGGKGFVARCARVGGGACVRRRLLTSVHNVSVHRRLVVAILGHGHCSGHSELLQYKGIILTRSFATAIVSGALNKARSGRCNIRMGRFVIGHVQFALFGQRCRWRASVGVGRVR